MYWRCIQRNVIKYIRETNLIDFNKIDETLCKRKNTIFRNIFFNYFYSYGGEANEIKLQRRIIVYYYYEKKTMRENKNILRISIFNYR